MTTSQLYSLPTATADLISQLIGACRDGYSLPGAFYSEPAVFEADAARVLRRGWLFACHSVEVREPGASVVFDFAGDSLIIIREDDGLLYALHNTCRHRGSRICDPPTGGTDHCAGGASGDAPVTSAASSRRLKQLICPYHQWSYARDGRLLRARDMGDDFDPAAHSLARAAIRETAGLVFVSLAEEPPSFDQAERDIAAHLAPHGLAGAKVAHVEQMIVDANWKLVWENNRECYHCPSSHPEYCGVTLDVWRDDPAKAPAVEQRIVESKAKWAAAGLTVDQANVSSDMTGAWHRVNRTPLKSGCVTESLDGQPVAPLMGDFTDADTGTCRATTLPNFWCHASSDHAVSTRLLPLNAGRTEARITWLVAADAEAGRDYSLDRLLPFWLNTSLQDWEICRRQQLGVQSSRYRPGPYAPVKEANVRRFVSWYLDQLRDTKVD